MNTRSIATGALTYEEALANGVETMWLNTNRFFYTFLLGRINRETVEGKLMLAQARALSSSKDGKSGVHLR